MLLNDDEIKERIESPLNLLNRLRSNLNSVTHKHSPPTIPSLPPTADKLIDDLEEKLSKSTIRAKAVGILSTAMDQLAIRIPEIQKAEKLAQIANEMSKVISNQDSRNQGEKSLAQIIVYAPQIQQIENYDVIDVNE